IAPRFSFVAFAGFGVDVVHVVPQAARSPNTRVAKPTASVSPLGRVAVGAQAHGPIRLALWFEADIDFAPQRFVWLDAGVERTLFTPFAFRPGILLEIGTP